MASYGTGTAAELCIRGKENSHQQRALVVVPLRVKMEGFGASNGVRRHKIHSSGFCSTFKGLETKNIVFHAIKKL